MAEWGFELGSLLVRHTNLGISNFVELVSTFGILRKKVLHNDKIIAMGGGNSHRMAAVGDRTTYICKETEM